MDFSNFLLVSDKEVILGTSLFCNSHWSLSKEGVKFGFCFRKILPSVCWASGTRGDGVSSWMTAVTSR